MRNAAPLNVKISTEVLSVIVRQTEAELYDSLQVGSACRTFMKYSISMTFCSQQKVAVDVISGETMFHECPWKNLVILGETVLEIYDRLTK